MRAFITAVIVGGVMFVTGGHAPAAEDPASGASAEPPAVAAPAKANAPASPAAPADDLAALVAAVAPPERFKDHVPKFTAKEEEFDLQLPVEKPQGREKEKAPGIGLFSDKQAEKGKAADKPSGKAGAAEKAGPPQRIRAKLWVIRDGPHAIAVYHAKASKLYFLAADPAKAGEKLDLPQDYSDSGNTFDGLLGARLTTFSPCYDPVQTGDHAFAFTPGKKNATLALTDTTRWPDREKAEAVYALTFRYDPVLGYVVECEVDFRTDSAKDEKGRPLDPELMNFFPNHVYMRKRPDAAWRYEWTVYTPAGDAKQAAEGRYIGWVNDFGQSDRARGMRLPSGGFVLFAADPDGAGPAVACTAGEGTALKNDTGNLQFDQHYRLSLPEKADAEGLYRVRAKFRYATLPPEVVRHVMERMEVTDLRGSLAVPLKVGRTEGFEDEAAILKGSLVYKDLPTTDREFHTGKTSLMLVGGRKMRIDPSPPLEAGATYRLDAWVKVAGRLSEARLVAEPAKWLPKDVTWETQLSPIIKSSDQWQKVALEFTSGPGGSTPWLYLGVSRSGTAYLDDIVITKVENKK